MVSVPRPVTVARVAAWTNTLAAKGLALAPVSALVVPPAKQEAAKMSDLPYRPNVGAVLFNQDGLVFVARRADMPNAEGPAGGWQLPQGGIDEGEDPGTAVLRELEEEIGTRKAECWRTSGLADIRPAAEPAGYRLARPLRRPAPALVRHAFHGEEAISASTLILTPSLTPGAGWRWRSCRRWPCRSSGRFMRC